MTKMADVFAQTKAEGRAALIGYFPAGFPTLEDSITIIRSMVENGVDIVEIGLPYSDPLMDGPVIEQAVEQALHNGINTDGVLKVVEGVAQAGAPTLVMSYWNPILKFGQQRFASALHQAGGSGVITPDLTPEEAGEWISATDENDIDRVFLVAPSSTQERLGIVSDVCSGFVYAASTMGVTGARSTVSHHAKELVERTRSHTEKPICVGLGVSTPAQAEEIATYADGVIVGSAFVKAAIEANDVTEAAARVGRLAAELAQGVRA
ncbi:MAG: tryptophan synthase subunit alpha [Candidatus Nanopelagicales bacterium]